MEADKDDKVNHPREDDRNEEIDASPVPDPEDGSPSEEADPEAD